MDANWAVNHEEDKIQLLYGETVVKEQFRQPGGDGALVAYYKATAVSFNARKWKPTFSPWILQAGRILEDSLQRDHGRRVDHVWKDPEEGLYTIACHCGASFKVTITGMGKEVMDEDLRIVITDWEILEIGSRSLESSEQDQIASLVSMGTLLKVIQDRSAARELKSGKKDRKTSAEKHIEAEQQKLADWLSKKPITS
tara:strand:+ start:537 stop:1130 length:594 start_codon:yes stop_codon:yes gene_type:complete